MSTEGNVAIVTGAAQGIGRAIATCLLSQGYKVKYIVSPSSGEFLPIFCRTLRFQRKTNLGSSLIYSHLYDRDSCFISVICGGSSINVMGRGPFYINAICIYLRILVSNTI